jgi:hypothetical protein
LHHETERYDDEGAAATAVTVPELNFFSKGKKLKN